MIITVECLLDCSFPFSALYDGVNNIKPGYLTWMGTVDFLDSWGDPYAYGCFLHIKANTNNISVSQDAPLSQGSRINITFEANNGAGATSFKVHHGSGGKAVRDSNNNWQYGNSTIESQPIYSGFGSSSQYENNPYPKVNSEIRVFYDDLIYYSKDKETGQGFAEGEPPRAWITQENIPPLDYDKRGWDLIQNGCTKTNYKGMSANLILGLWDGIKIKAGIIPEYVFLNTGGFLS